MYKLYKFVSALMLFPANILLAIAPSTTPPTVTISDKMSLWQLFIPLAIVLASIFLLAWLVKKFGKKIPMLNSDIKIHSMAAISNHAKLVLVDVEGSSLLIGITNQNISLIKDFSGQIKIPKEAINPNVKKQFTDYIQKDNKSVETST